jgi:hypothetical protein
MIKYASKSTSGVPRQFDVNNEPIFALVVVFVIKKSKSFMTIWQLLLFGPRDDFDLMA